VQLTKLSSTAIASYVSISYKYQIFSSYFENDTIYLKNRTTHFTSKDKKKEKETSTKTKYYYNQYNWIVNFKT